MTEQVTPDAVRECERVWTEARGNPPSEFCKGSIDWRQTILAYAAGHAAATADRERIVGALRGMLDYWGDEDYGEPWEDIKAAARAALAGDPQARA